MSAVGYGKHVCCAAQQTCLHYDTADKSAVGYSRHCLLRDPADEVDFSAADMPEALECRNGHHLTRLSIETGLDQKIKARDPESDNKSKGELYKQPSHH